MRKGQASAGLIFSVVIGLALAGALHGVTAPRSLDGVLGQGNSAGQYDLNMNNNSILNVNEINGESVSSILDASVEDIWVNESGDTMSGDLQMDGNDILGVYQLQGTVANGFDLMTTENISVNDRVRVSGAVENPSGPVTLNSDVDARGNLNMNDNNIFGVSDINADFIYGLSSIITSNASVTDRLWVNGKTEMSDNLNMTGNNITDVDTVHGTSPVRFGDSIDMGGNSLSGATRFKTEEDIVARYNNDTVFGTIETDTEQYGNYGGIIIKPYDEVSVSNKGEVDILGDVWVENILQADSIRVNKEVTSDRVSTSNIVGNPFGVPISVEEDFDMNSRSVINLADPTDPQDAATKSYVDNNDDVGFTEDVWVNESGDKMTGNLNMTGNNITDVDTIHGTSPVRFGDSIDMGGNVISSASNIDSGEVNAGDLVTDTIWSNGVGDTGITPIRVKNQLQVDHNNGIYMVGNPLKMAGGDVTGIGEIRANEGEINSGSSLNMTGNNITNLGDPVNPQDAATKSYVDAEAQTEDVWVNESGDTMTGDLNMQGNSVNLNGDAVFSNGNGVIIEQNSNLLMRLDNILEVGTVWTNGLRTASGNDFVQMENGEGIDMGGANLTNARATNTDVLDLDTTTLPTCDASTEGEIRYNGTAHYGCDGTSWNQLY